MVVTRLAYDDTGNITSRREAVGTVLERETVYTYEPAFNRVAKITDLAGYETLFDYDANGNLLKTTDALGGEEVRTYNIYGQVLTETDASRGPFRWHRSAVRRSRPHV